MKENRFAFLFLAVLILAASPSLMADPMGMNEAMCRSPQYYECFGVSKQDCLKNAERPIAYCYRAIGMKHPMIEQLKPVLISLKGTSGVDIGKCGEATYFKMYERNLVKSDSCRRLMDAEQKRWSPELSAFSQAVFDASK